MIWKKVEILRFEDFLISAKKSCFPFFFMRRLGKLSIFGSQMGLHMKLIAKKELILLFQMTPSRILCD